MDEVAALAALTPILDASLRPYASVVATPAEGELVLWANKACDGRPYLPKSERWPAAGGRDLIPVLQLDFATLPELPGFPRAGLLALWWSEDYQDCALRYYPEIVRDGEQLWSDFSRVPRDLLYPYCAPVALSFERREGTVSWNDYRFEQLVGQDLLAELHDSPSYEAVFHHVWERSGGNGTRLGGWACPQQGDPRQRPELAAYETQLLQIDNDNFTHNIFIKPADLARADFSDVQFYEACD